MSSKDSVTLNTESIVAEEDIKPLRKFPNIRRYKNKSSIFSTLNSTVTSKKLTVELTDNTLRGLVVESKSGRLDIHDAFALDVKDLIGGNKLFVSEQVIEILTDKTKYHKISGNKISLILTSLGCNDKVIKYPPLDKKTLNELIKESYMKFFTDHKEPFSIRGTELLGDMNIPKGELYYLLSSVPKKSMLDISLQLEREKLTIDTIYNEVLALTNVLKLLNPSIKTKALLYTKDKRVYVMFTRNNTLIFHKSIEIAKPIVYDTIDPSTLDVWSKNYRKPLNDTKNQDKLTNFLTNSLPDVSSTLDYVKQKEGLDYSELLIAGDLVEYPNIEHILTEELGTTTKILDVLSSDNLLDIANWTKGSITADYLVPLGLSLRGLV